VHSIRRLIPGVVLIALLVALGSAPLAATAARLERPVLPLSLEAGAVAQAPERQTIPAAFVQVGENEGFQLYADPATLAFKVVDKRSGYVWHSNLDEVGEEDALNRTWTAFATSGISIDYVDQAAASERASITNAEHTIDFNRIDQGFQASLTFVAPSITLGVTVQLEPDGVRVEVPFDSLSEADPRFRMGLLHLYPFFGAARENTIPGYMFVPDGSGTLIALAAETKARNMFLGRYYGPDLGMLTSLPFDPTINRPYQISIPVLGMVHGEKEHAFISIVEKGASYGELRAHPAGVTTKFNFLYNAFIYNQSYFQATNRSGAGVTTLQPATNAFDVVVHYRFLTGDDSDYVGMALSYQDYLVEKGMLREQLDASNDIGIRLEFLGAEREKILFWHRSIPVTTLAQMSEILDQLEVSNPDVVYYGWQPGGANSMYPPSLAIDGILGTRGQLASIAEEVAANGRFYLYVDPQAALQDVGGYSRRHDLAMSITNSNLAGANRFKGNYYLNMGALGERYRALRRDLSNHVQAGLAVDGLGSTLYSDFRNDKVVTRESAIQVYQELMSETGGDTAFYLPNDYMFPYMRAYYDMPVTDSGYLYTTQVVPFLQIALGGYVPMYGRALNFSPDLRADLLRHADFGVYPSYFLTHAPTSTILRTSSGWIFSSSYDQWGQIVEENYQWLNELLAPVKGERVVARQSLGSGVFATTYSNGQQIVVNYNTAPFTSGSLFVDARNAIIREVEP
jgi:hypothetical protein